MIKQFKLPPRTKFYGLDHRKCLQYRMTGKEWHQYARRETFNKGADYAWGNQCEIWLDKKPLIDDNFPFAAGHEPK